MKGLERVLKVICEGKGLFNVPLGYFSFPQLYLATAHQHVVCLSQTKGGFGFLKV